MILLTKGQTVDIYLTLNERRTLDSGYYLIVFTNQAENSEVTKIWSFLDDDSDYPSRYNKFSLVVNSLFTGKAEGLWNYAVYEQESSTNTDPTGLTEVERGIMKLSPATEFAFEEYNEETSYKQYRP